MKNAVAVIVAGGTGSRLKSRIHKPFVVLAGRPMLAWTLAAFEKTAGIGGIVLVAHGSDQARARSLVRRFKFRKVLAVVAGGATRMESVSFGLRAVPPWGRWVAVHDAARPMVTARLIDAALREARRSKAVITAVPVIPTVKEARDGHVTRTLDRSRLWAVQTPQVFERKLLERAHAKGRAQRVAATDDAALVERLGVKVRIVPGLERNIKVTTPDDRVVAEAFLRCG